MQVMDLGQPASRRTTVAGNRLERPETHRTTPVKVDVFVSFGATVPQVFSFGTSGHRAIGEKFDQAVLPITNAIADHRIAEMLQTREFLPLMVGGDTRQKTAQHCSGIAEALRQKGLSVYLVTNPVPTPVLAFYAKYFDQLKRPHQKTAGAILLTASHNPWPYGGINFLTPDAEVAPTAMTKEFEALQREPRNLTLNQMGQIHPLTLTGYEYLNHVETLIDFDRIRKANLEIFYDPMLGAAKDIFPWMMAQEDIRMGTIQPNMPATEAFPDGPDPKLKYLGNLIDAVTAEGLFNPMRAGFAHDGDADRFFVASANGRALTPNEVLALTLYHLAKNKGRRGIVVRSQATSHQLDALAKYFGMETVQTPVGYKYIAEVAKESEIPMVIGGESSGGLSIYGHIPEKDGIIANLSVMEAMAYENNSPSGILRAVNNLLPQKFRFSEWAVSTEKADALMAHFETLRQQGGEFNGIRVDDATSRQKVAELEQRFHTPDGVKLYLEDGSWFLLRKSGTEGSSVPLLRIYFESVAGSEAEVAAKHEKFATGMTQFLRDADISPETIQINY